MKRTILLCCVPLMSLLIFVTNLIPLCSSAQYKCKNPEETCMQYNNCPNLKSEVRSKNFERCDSSGISICCKHSTTVTTPPPSASLASRKNATAVILENCQKYQLYKYQNITKDGDLPGESQITLQITNCVAALPIISNGVPARPREFPHMALIGYGETFEEVDWNCGGSLISENFILSAAHCAISKLPKWVLLGDLNISSTNDDALPAVYSIVDIYNHPQFNGTTLHNDITLFKLNTTVKMNAYVRPACLSTLPSTSLNSDSELIITGWGRTAAVEKKSKHLLKATIYLGRQCGNTYENYNETTQICAGDLEDGKDTCVGDSGGPLQTINAVPCMWDIVGVISYGTVICGSNIDLAVYTRVSFYLDWIQSIVWP